MAQITYLVPAASFLASGGKRSSWSGCEESTNTMPTTSEGYWLANIRTSLPPRECPTNTNGPAIPASCSRVCSSSAITFVVRGLGLGSLHPSPARSYEHTRVYCAARCFIFYPRDQ